MKFTRRPDLDPHTRVEIVRLAWLNQQQFPETRQSQNSSGILTCLFVNLHAKMELS